MHLFFNFRLAVFTIAVIFCIVSVKTPTNTVLNNISENFEIKDVTKRNDRNTNTSIKYVNSSKRVKIREETLMISKASSAENSREKETEKKTFTTGYNNRSTQENVPELSTFNDLSNVQGGDISQKGKRHIAFLKVHKAASTTLQTMFFRFGFERNLSFVLPIKGNYFSKSSETHEDLLPPTHGDHYDIICNHGIFSHKIYSGIMPNDTVYLAVVRKPFDQFVSAVNYYTELYKFQYLLNVPEDRIENLIKYPEKYDKPLSYTMNSMSRDFGFKERYFFSESNLEAKRYLKNLGKIFDFVLIAEYFDESLILMKRFLQWSLKDVLYISKNVRGSTVEVSEHLMSVFRIRNKLDYLVYDFFLEKFKRTLKKYEDSVMAETEHFRRILSIVQDWCQDKSTRMLTVDASKWNERFVLNNRDCKLMMKKELSFVKLLKNGTTEL